MATLRRGLEERERGGPHADAKTRGATRFNRLEGTYLASRSFWFSDTMGGEKRLGQVFRYRPKTETLERFYAGTKPGRMESPDNIIVTPWGDLWFAEDETVEGNNRNRLVRITPAGQVYVFASNRLNNPEFASPTFSPDGRTLFVNLRNPGITLAIWGPFRENGVRNQRQMATAATPDLWCRGYPKNGRRSRTDTAWAPWKPLLTSVSVCPWSDSQMMCDQTIEKWLLGASKHFPVFSSLLEI